MKDILSLFVFGLGALCFFVFVAVVRPNAVIAVSGSQQESCRAAASPTESCRRQVSAAAPAGAAPLRQSQR
jgi:hypothetical protein